MHIALCLLTPSDSIHTALRDFARQQVQLDACLQIEALSELKQYKEALQALDIAAQQDKEFAKGKDMRLMQKQLRAVIK